MRVLKAQRKLATLLLLSDQRKSYEQDLEPDKAVTAYTVASWQSVPQPQMWNILNDLRKSRFVKRHRNPMRPKVITYSLTRRGQAYVDQHLLECMYALELVRIYKVRRFDDDIPF